MQSPRLLAAGLHAATGPRVNEGCGRGVVTVMCVVTGWHARRAQVARGAVLRVGALQASALCAPYRGAEERLCGV